MIMDVYRKTKPYYNEVKGSRKSGLNNDFCLLMILKTIGYSVDSDDFKLAETTDILENDMEIIPVFRPVEKTCELFSPLT